MLYLGSYLLLFLYLIWAATNAQVWKKLPWTPPLASWAIALPLWIVGLIPFTILMYMGSNLRSTPNWQDPCQLTDKKALVFRPTPENIGRILNPEQIPEMEDVPIGLVNQCWVLSNRG